MSAMYSLGREARQLGYGRDACNIPAVNSVGRIKRSAWLCGWHDEDMNLDARYQVSNEG